MPFAQGQVQIGTVVVTAVIEVRLRIFAEGLEHAVLVQHAQRHEVASHVVAPTHRDVVLALQGHVFHHVVDPVYIRIEDRLVVGAEVFNHFVRESRIGAVAQTGLIECRCIRVRIGLLQEVRYRLDTPRRGNRNIRLACFTTFGCHQDDTVGTAHTVHRRGRGVFQDGDVCHFIRVDLGERTLHAVHQHQGVRAVQRRLATDEDGRVVFARQAGVLHRRQARQFAGDGVAQRSGGGFQQFLAVYVRDRTGDCHLLLLAVGDDHHFVQHFIVRDHRHLHCAPGHFLFLGLVPNVRKDQCASTWD